MAKRITVTVPDILHLNMEMDSEVLLAAKAMAKRETPRISFKDWMARELRQIVAKKGTR